MSAGKLWQDQECAAGRYGAMQAGGLCIGGPLHGQPYPNSNQPFAYRYRLGEFQLGGVRRIALIHESLKTPEAITLAYISTGHDLQRETEE